MSINIRRTRRTAALAGLLCLAPVLAACGSDDDGGGESSDGGSAGGDPIKVMTLGPIDAPGFSIPGIVTAAEAAIDKVNKAGGVNGRDIELVVCNDKNDPNTAAGCARQATQEGVVAVLGGLSTMEAQAVPGFEKAGIPMIGITPLAVFNSPVYYPFSSGGAGSYFGLAKAMVDDPACGGKAAMLLEDFAAAQGAAQLFQLGMAASGGQYAGDAKAAPGASDFGPAAAAAADKANCIAFAVGPQSAPQVVTAIGATDGVDVFGGSDTLIQVAITALGDKADGALAVTDFLPASSDSEEVADFVKRSEAIDPDFETNQITASTYAAVELFAEIMDGVDDITPESVTAAVQKVASYDTGLGPVADFTAQNPAKTFSRLPLKSPMYVTAAQGGELVLTDAEPFDIAGVYEAAAAAGQ